MRKSREQEVVAFMQTGSATRIQAAVRGWRARRLFEGALLASLMLASAWVKPAQATVRQACMQQD